MGKKTAFGEADQEDGALDDCLITEVGIDEENHLVGIKFGQPISWFAMPPDQAEQLAQSILKKAAQVRKLMN